MRRRSIRNAWPSSACRCVRLIGWRFTATPSGRRGTWRRGSEGRYAKSSPSGGNRGRPPRPADRCPSADVCGSRAGKPSCPPCAPRCRTTRFCASRRPWRSGPGNTRRRRCVCAFCSTSLSIVPPGTWDILDLGTGSGILALAGKVFGARAALGLDHDPHAVRTARQNARLNQLASPTLRFGQADLPSWTRPARQTWHVVTANLFSELLIRLMPRVLLPSIAPGGDLVLSGVLATQADEVVASIHACGLTLVTTRRRGRWRAFHCRREHLPLRGRRNGCRCP